MVRRYRHNPNPASLTKGGVSLGQIESLSLDFETCKANAAETEEVEIRTRWRSLTEEDLPRAADLNTDWPVYLNHCFARILLDNAVGQFWRDVITPPAWKNTPLPVLQTAIDLGDSILAGDADIWVLNDNSLKMRGKAPRGKRAARRRSRRRAAQ